MDSMGYSSTERVIQANDLVFSHEALASDDVPELSDKITSRQSHKDSIIPWRIDSQDYRLIEKNPAAAEANSKPVHYDCCLVVTDEDKARSTHSQNVVGADGDPTFEKQELHIVSVSSGTGNHSDLTSKGGYESSQTPYANVDYSDNELDSVFKWTIEDKDKDLINPSDAQDGWSSENDSEVPREMRQAPTIISWKNPAVDKSEIASSVYKPQKSDISNLGDREFYANLNATSRKSNASLLLDDNRQHLALQDHFFEALVRVHKEKKGFLPRAQLSSLVTEDCVFNELTRCLKTTHNSTKIQEYAKSIFLIEKTSSMSKFLEEDINDLDLPLVKLENNFNGSRFELRLQHMQDKRLECLEE